MEKFVKKYNSQPRLGCLYVQHILTKLISSVCLHKQKADNIFKILLTILWGKTWKG
jgi:endonuclease III